MILIHSVEALAVLMFHFCFYLFMWMMLIISDDGKLVAESDSGEFWVLFGGFAPIGKKVTGEDDVTMETTPGKLYRYFIFLFIAI